MCRAVRAVPRGAVQVACEACFAPCLRFPSPAGCVRGLRPRSPRSLVLTLALVRCNGDTLTLFDVLPGGVPLSFLAKEKLPGESLSAAGAPSARTGFCCLPLTRKATGGNNHHNTKLCISFNPQRTETLLLDRTQYNTKRELAQESNFTISHCFSRKEVYIKSNEIWIVVKYILVW